MRTEDEVIDIMRVFYKEEFGGKSNQRFRLTWADLRSIYGVGKLFRSRFKLLQERAYQRGLYIWCPADEDEIVVIRCKTVDRWRRVPKRIIDEYRESADPQDLDDEEDD